MILVILIYSFNIILLFYFLNYFYTDDANNACNNGQIRLAPTTNTSGPFSRVQTCYGGLWGYICPDGWDLLEARVVCRELGLPIACKDFEF